MRFGYVPDPWALNDKDHDEDGNIGPYEGGSPFLFACPSEVRNGPLSSSSSLDGEWQQTSQGITPHLMTLDAAACSSYATLDRSLLVARYSGKANHSFDVGTVLANGPLPKDVAVFYFEATFHALPPHAADPTREDEKDDDAMESSENNNENVNNNGGDGGAVQDSEDRGGAAERNPANNPIGGCIGLVGDNFPVERSPGTLVGSVGLRCRDGKVQQAPNEEAMECTPPIHSGDTVGCGVIMASQKVFFSHNGKKFAPADLKHSTCFTQELYPAVTVHGLGESVTINFGQEPFKFDLRNFEEEEIRRVRAKIVEIQVSDSLVQQFVADYLLRQGCEKTLASLRNANKEIWSRDSAVDDDAAAACIPGDDSATMETTMENCGVEHSMSKCNKEKDGNATMMQVEFSNEDWNDRLVADAGRTVEMEEYDSSSCCNDGDEEKKSEEEDKGGMKTTTILVSSILLNGVSMERFEGNLQVRSAVRQHLLSGDVANAIDLLRSEFPALEQKPHIWGALECQEFIERIKRREFIEAAQYARQILAPNMLGNLPSSISSMDTSTGSSPRGNKRPMGIHDCHKRRIGPRTTGLSPQFGSQKYLNHHFHQQHKPSQQETMAGEVVGLLAYKNVGSSPLSYLLSKKRRQYVANLCNEAVVEFVPLFSPMGELYTLGGLELLAAHYIVTQELLYKEAGGRGRPFVLEDCMDMNILPD